MNLENPVKSAQWQRLTLELCGSVDGGCCHPRHIFIEKCRHMPNCVHRRSVKMSH